MDYTQEVIQNILDDVCGDDPLRGIARENLEMLIENDPLMPYIDYDTLDSMTAAFLDGYTLGYKAGLKAGKKATKKRQISCP